VAKKKKTIKKQAKKQIRKTQREKGMWNYLKSESNPKKLDWKVFILSIIAVAITAYIGSMFTDTSAWYESIKPSIAPPNFVFPIVWTTLFYMIAVSLYYSWKESERKYREKVIIYYGLNLVLNVMWSYIFFKMQNPVFALIEIFVLLFSIAVLIGFNWDKSKKAAYFLIPYFLWVCFAIVLNYLAIK